MAYHNEDAKNTKVRNNTKAIRKKRQVTNKGKDTRKNSIDVLPSTPKPGYHKMKISSCQTRWKHPTKLYFKYEREIKHLKKSTD